MKPRTFNRSLRALLASAPLALLLLVAPGASATTVLQVDLQDLTRTSQWVVRAQVLDVHSVDRRATGQGLFTHVELAITDVYKGQDVPSHYTLRLVGGRGDDGTSMRVPGMPSFDRGEDVILFLEKTSIGHIPCGLGQGVWRVVQGADGTEWARQSIGGMHLMRRTPAGRLGPADPRMIEEVRAVEDLVADVVAFDVVVTPLMTTK